MDRVRLRTRVGIGLLTLYVLVFIVFVPLGPNPAVGAVRDVMNVGITLIAAGLCGLAAARTKGSLRWYWGLFALASTCSAAGEIVTGVYDLLRIAPSHPSPADALWLAFYPLAFAGLVCLMRARSRRRNREIVPTLDALLFCVAGAGLIWDLLLSPMVDHATGSHVDLLTIAYPAGDLLLLGALASLLFSSRGAWVPRGTRWMTASFAFALVADVIYMRMFTGGATGQAAWADPLWMLGYAFFGVAAIVFLDGHARPVDVPLEQRSVLVPRHGAIEAARIYVPYVSVLAAAFLSYNHFVIHADDGEVENAAMVVITCLIPVLVLLRQLFVSLENQGLQASLLDASHVLEVRVAERTEQLAAEKDRLHLLNQTAKEISRCATVQEVLDIGVDLLVRATGRKTVALAGHDQQGAFHFADSACLSESTRAWLTKSLRKFLAANAGSSDPSPVALALPRPFSDQAPSPLHGLTSTIVFPLMGRQAMLGVACVANEPLDASLTEEERNLAQNIAAQLAVALEVAHRYDDARFLADNDALTGLANRRTITERLEQEVARSERAGGYFSLIMMDVDDFKNCNDTYGHLVGDRALVATASALRQAVRAGDTVGRLGGDEFLAILPDTGSAGALQVVERIKHYLANHPVNAGNGALLPIEVSCGVAVFPVHGEDAEQLLRVADENMYFFKRHGDKRGQAYQEVMPVLEASGSGATILDSLINSIDAREHYTKRHSDEVAKYATALATRLGLSPGEVKAVRLAGLLHDIGKIGVPDGVLLKQGALSGKEYDLVRQHVQVGHAIIRDIPSLHEVLEGVTGHHERYDGSGYPDGLKGAQIPIQARILAAADAYAAMTADRVYAPALSEEDARKELQRVSGTQLDPIVVDELLALLSDNQRARKEAPPPKTVRAAP